MNIFGHGGGIIKRKSILVVLMLFTLTLPLTANTGFAVDNITSQNSDQINQNNGQILENTMNTSSKQQNTAGKQTSNQQPLNLKIPPKDPKKFANSSIAAGSAAGSTQSTTSTVSTSLVSFSIDQINSAAVKVKSFIETNHRLPNYVTVSTVQVSMPQFMQLMADNLVNLGNGLKTSVTLESVDNPTTSSESVKSGNIYKTEYLSLAQTIKNTIESTGTAPDYINTSLGKIRYESIIYTFSKILNYQKTYQRLPNTVSVAPWTGTIQSSSSTEGSNALTSSSASSLQQYLVATTNAQSDDSAITSLAASITAGLTSEYDKATAIFNWVRDHLTYSYYYNSKKGALGALSSRTANCCDTSHLVVALARASGIPARYQHGSCTFSDGTFGHVWAQLYVNGKWYYADAISKSNTFGVIKNWNLNTYKLYGTYASLPF